jgi:hypothetical protein
MVYVPSQSIVATPFAELAPVIEDGTIQQIIKLSLMSNLRFGMEFEETELWPGQLGQTMTIPRSRPLAYDEEELAPQTDPEYRVQKYEEMAAQCAKFAQAIRLDMTVGKVALKGYFANRMNELSKSMAFKLNAARRRKLYTGYEGGHAIANNTAAPGTSVQVSSINGFTHQISSDGKLLPVSTDNPKPIRIGASTFAFVTAVSAADPAFPFGRGTLTLSANTNYTAGDAVVAMDASHRVYVGGGDTIDAIGTTDILTMQAIRDAVVRLEEDSIPKHSDGTYWVHLTPTAKSQLWADPEFQNLLRGNLRDASAAKYVLAQLMGCTFIENNEVPRLANASAVQASRSSQPSARLHKGIYSEIINAAGRPITHTLITGGGLGKTWYLDPRNMASAAGLNAVEYYGMQVSADNMTMVLDNYVRMLVAAPRDDLREQVPANGLFLGDFMLYSDFFGGSYSPNMNLNETQNPRFKRAATVVHFGA